MSSELYISVIIPFYNAEIHIKKCLDVLHNQDFNKSFEVIMIDDGSTDKSQNIIKAYNYPGLQLFFLPKNSGPSAARNVGLKKAKGEYVFFLDVDDTIAENTLTTMYSVANENECDMVFCDHKHIENAQNQRNNIFNYPADRAFGVSDFKESMWKRFHDPFNNEIKIGDKGRLIRRSIIKNNNILFDEKLRYMEDEIFQWCVLAFIGSARYVRKQLYSHYVYPNVNTGLSESLNLGFPVSHFKLMKNHIQNGLKQREFSSEEIIRIGNQALIFFIISALVSYSRSMLFGKVELKNGVKCRRKIIDDILDDLDVSKAIRNYSCSKKESPWIPRAIAWRSRKFLEFACTRRAKEILRIRRKGKI